MAKNSLSGVKAKNMSTIIFELILFDLLIIIGCLFILDLTIWWIDHLESTSIVTLVISKEGIGRQIMGINKVWFVFFYEIWSSN